MKDQDQQTIDQLKARLDEAQNHAAAIRDGIRQLMQLAIDEQAAIPKPAIEPEDPVERDGWATGRVWASNPGAAFPKTSPYGSKTEENATWWAGFSTGADSVEEGTA